MHSLLVALALTAPAQYPDALDHLRAGDVVPQVGLLLDRSCSMGSGHEWTACDWYGDQYARGSRSLDKTDQMKSVLVGCRTPDDGLLDRWADKINFSIYEFGSGTQLRVPFGSTGSQLEAGVLQIPHSGSTYMSQGIRDMSKYFQDYFDRSNTLECRPSFIVMLSDGNPNGGGATYDFECTAPVERVHVGANEPWKGSDYVFSHPDMLCSVPGDQPIRTYTIGFGKPGDFSPSNLQQIAEQGGGEYFYASDSQQLGVAFETIISEIVAKSALFFAPIAIQSDAFYSENYAYSTSFRPEAGGPWKGTLKKYCVTPPTDTTGAYATDVDSCLFLSPDGQELETNPNAMDLFTGLRALNADSGGTGAVLKARLGAGEETIGSPYWEDRNIVTWRPGEASYVPVRPETWSAEDSWTNGCQHYKLINRLYGYTYDADCSTGAPTRLADWPLGDSVHFSPVVLKYDECHREDGTPIPGACFVVSGANDGMVHFVDSATGEEKSALIPGELWQPGDVPNNLLRDLMDQPNLRYTHRFYVDGDARLFHEDDNADGFIQSSEAAYLVFGLGRGGRAYYSIPINRLEGGQLDARYNPVFPLVAGEGTPFAELQDTWAAPWLGLGRFADGERRRVAAFGTGHVAELDVVETPPTTPSQPPLPPGQTAPEFSRKETVNCNGRNHFADFNGLDQAHWCHSMWYSRCRGNRREPCYDGAGVPLDQSTQRLTYNDGVSKAAALRLQFNQFDLHSGDVLRIEDGQGNLVGAYSSSSLKGKWSAWVHGEELVLRLLTDGRDTRNRGYIINKVQWVPGEPIVEQPPAGGGSGGVAPPVADFVLGRDHLPSVDVVDLDRWNGANPVPFANAATADGILLRVTKDCAGLSGDVCIDATENSDLEDMICPVSAEVTAYTEGGFLRALYWGDECGQIWKTWTDDGGRSWSARRIINLNNGVIDHSRDQRKIFRKIDLVLSRCAGRPALGLYFGTGNIQRPGAKDELTDPAITNGRDIVGVVWDVEGLPSGLTDQALADVTQLAEIDPKTLIASQKFGWYLSLNENERMLRDPLVFDQVAYFKTFEPTQTALECGGGSGVDRVYALDSCTAAAANDENGDGSRTMSEREAWNGQTEVGGGLFFFTPKDSPVLVSHADITKQQKARLNRRERRRPGLFLWREL